MTVDTRTTDATSGGVPLSAITPCATRDGTLIDQGAAGDAYAGTTGTTWTRRRLRWYKRPPVAAVTTMATCNDTVFGVFQGSDIRSIDARTTRTACAESTYGAVITSVATMAS